MGAKAKKILPNLSIEPIRKWSRTIKLNHYEKNFFTSYCSHNISSSYYFTFIYNATYSEGVRSGQLINLAARNSFKTWEGEISQGISDHKSFLFSFR
jgi:hypothetical protein